MVILAYVLGTQPINTVQEFEMNKGYLTMEECKKELLLETRIGYYDVVTDFIIQFDGKYDWITAGCVNMNNEQEKFQIFPEYKPGEKPEGIDQILNGPGINI